MGRVAIKVERLGKKYVIGHQPKVQGQTFGELLSGSIKRAWSKKKDYNAQKANQEEFWAVRDLDFEINQGDRVGIIGRNGAGKSTLLKILSRITEPSEGRIRINGRVASLLEVGTGFHPELSGRENIFLNGAILGMSRSEIRSKFDEIVAFAEVEKFLDTPVKRYSSGMYVRLAFAVAAHLEPEILIVDEVLAVGDAQFQKKCLGKMEDVSKNEGRTVLFVSHQMGTIAQLCERAIFLQKGKLITDGNTLQVIEKYLSGNQHTETNKYVCSEENQSLVFFKEVSTVNANGQGIEEFGFNEEINVMIKVRLKKEISNLKIGITLQNMHGYYVSTSIFEVDEKSALQNDFIKLKVSFPANIIAPNSYYFRLAAFTDNEVYDVQENICSTRVIDTGSALSKYEGINYGSVILNTSWIITK